MLRTSVSALSEQLSIFTETINSDCNLMKSKLKHPPPKSSCKSELAYLDNIIAGMKDLEGRADGVEEEVMGPPEHRLNQITVEELLYCAATLYEANEEGIRRVKAARNPLPGTPASTYKGARSSKIDHSKENVVNKIQAETPKELKFVYADAADDDEDLNGCVVDLSYQSERLGGNDMSELPQSPEPSNGEPHDSVAEEDFMSPQGRPGGASFNDEDEDPKTPSLEAWKLSNATRHILDQQRYISRGEDKSPNNILSKNGSSKMKVQPPKNYSNAQVVTRAQANTPPSPDLSNMSSAYIKKSNTTSAALATSLVFEGGTPISPNSADHSLVSKDGYDYSEMSPPAKDQEKLYSKEILSTPIDEAREILRTHNQLDYSTLSTSPATPTFMGAPLTCQVIDPLATENKRDVSALGGRSMMAINDEDGDQSIHQSCHASKLDISMADSEDSFVDPSSLVSPPKAVKVLNPRRGENAIIADAENGWIPKVTEEEWKTAPSFLKMQFGINDINETLILLNKFIADNLTKTESGFSKRLETFSFDEIVRIVGRSIDPAPIKVVVLGLVHFKKLDVGTENSIKVYKIRRFY